MKAAALVLSVIGAALLIAGIALGATSVTRDGVACGSGFSGVSSRAEVSDLTNAMTGFGGTSAMSDCSAAVGDRKTFALVLAVPGAVILLAGVLTSAAARRPAQ